MTTYCAVMRAYTDSSGKQGFHEEYTSPKSNARYGRASQYGQFFTALREIDYGGPLLVDRFARKQGDESTSIGDIKPLRGMKLNTRVFELCNGEYRNLVELAQTM